MESKCLNQRLFVTERRVPTPSGRRPVFGERHPLFPLSIPASMSAVSLYNCCLWEQTDECCPASETCIMFDGPSSSVPAPVLLQ